MNDRFGHARADDVAEAAAILRRGGLVGLPTETVYGLAADATDGLAVAAIYQSKGRPRFNPLIVHVNDLEAAGEHGRLDARARALAERFWPGPLTLVVPLRETSPVSSLALGGLDSIALRAPAHPLALAVLTACGLPLAAPSANRSGRVSATTADDVRAELGSAVDMVLDGGPARIGLESTVLSLLDDAPRLLRPGGLPRAALEEALGRPLAEPLAGTLHGPGMLPSHYAPDARLRMNALESAPDEAFLAFGPGAPAGALNLSASGDLAEAATNLFGFLRRLDAGGPSGIAVAPVPEHGLGEAINDRLRRAAAAR